nr:aminopeptidase N [Ferrovibrio sp.]
MDARTAEIQQPQAIRREDYRAPDYRIDHVDLTFDLEPKTTRVLARLAMQAAAPGKPLVLDGEALKLLGIAIDGRALAATEYALDDKTLTITAPPAGAFLLEIETEIDPAGNTQLTGLYQSSGNYCTQCEAQGFRRITYFLDRPDVMATYRVT